jgi:outer membrane protein insertion porin family
MKNGFVIILVCSFSVSAVECIAQQKIESTKIEIVKVRFVGATAISNLMLSENFHPSASAFMASDTATINVGLNRIGDLYHSKGYPFFKVDSINTVIDSASSPTLADSSNATLVIYVSEGPHLVLGKLLINGNRFFNYEELTSDLATRPGRPFNEDDLEEDIDKILSKYSEAGFPLVRVSIDSIFIYHNGIDSLGISLTVSEKNRIRINAVKVEGNTRTKDYVILRALRIPMGSYYNEKEFAEAKERLVKTGLFKSVSNPEIFEDGDTTGILLKVAEGSTNTFDGVIGYVPPQFGQTGYFTGMIDVSMSNLFGTGRKFRAMWHQETRSTQELEVGYSEPYIFNLPVNMEVDFSQRQQDSTFITRNLSFTGAFLFSDYFKGTLSVSTLSTTPLQRVDDDYSVFESNVLNLGVGVVLDTRDDLYNPHRGVLYRTDFSFGRKRIYGPPQLITSTNQLLSYIQHLSIELSLFHEIFARQILAVGVHGEQVTGNGLDQSDMYRIGGTNTIRGYIENQFIAAKAAWSNVEYRFAMSKESFFFGFVDAGYIYEQSDIVRKIPPSMFSVYGYGVGAQVETGIGILKASYALGKGDSFTDGKIHFGIVNRF